MTAAFTPAPGILDCTKNTLNFMKVNAGMFWHFLKPYLPYLVGAQLVGIGVMLAGGPPIGDIIAGFFVTCFMITWHRFVMFGAQRTIPVKPLFLTRHEWRYVIAVAVMGVFVALVSLTGLLKGVVPALLAALLTLGLLAVVLWGIVRFSLYFPAMATGAAISPARAFEMSKGYGGKIAGAYVLTTALLFVPIYVVALVLAVVAALFGGLAEPAQSVVRAVIMLPMDVVLVPMLAVGAVTVLTNYYMLGKETKRS